MIEVTVFQNLIVLPGHQGSFKSLKMPFWMILSAKKEVVGHFLDYGLLNRLDIAYCDTTECFPALTFSPPLRMTHREIDDRD